MPIDPLKETPSQTAGPFVHIGFAPHRAGFAMPFDTGSPRAHAVGERIVLTGQVLDGSGAPVTDAVVELVQADAAGAVGDKAIWLRSAIEPETACYRFETVRPGAIGDGCAAYVTLWIFARGVNIHLETRAYFPEDTDAPATDPVLSRIEQRHRVETLIATADGPGQYRFDIRLQGERETVFLDV